MYAIRSYYGLNRLKAEFKSELTSYPFVKEVFDDHGNYLLARFRITSYNVCYTKLLRQLMAAAEPQPRNHHAHEAAVKGHAAFPDLQDLQRMRQIPARLIEQHEAEAPAQHDPQNHCRQQFFDQIRRHRGHTVV